MLSDRTKLLLTELSELEARCKEVGEALSKSLEEDTHSIFGLCTARTAIQLYHNSGSSYVATNTLKNIVDGKVLNTRWDDNRSSSYNFNINQVPCTVIVSKEGNYSEDNL